VQKGFRNRGTIGAREIPEKEGVPPAHTVILFVIELVSPSEVLVIDSVTS
jgi:hypothetical protein